MMATTHVFAGVAIATAVAALVPELAPVVAVAAIVGGFFPDLDLYAGHRKTLHFPVYYTGCAVATAAIALVAPTAVTIAVAVFFLAAATHSLMDVFGGGLELKPWLGTSERAVYDHYRETWIRPRRWVRYDGAPEDFLLGAALALPGIVVFDGVIRDVVVALLAISFVYAVVRKPLVYVTEWLVGRIPDEVLEYVPERFLSTREDVSDQTGSH